MKVALPTVAILAAMSVAVTTAASQQHALFVRTDAIRNGKTRVTREAPSVTSADQMVQNILQWLQGVYAQNSRRIRQGTFREYLPPTNTQKPRPFEPNAGDGGSASEDNFIGYPPAGFSPNPPFVDNGGDNNEAYTPPKTPYPTQKPSGFTSASEGYPPAGSTPQPPFTGYPPSETPSETPGTLPPPSHPPPTHPPSTYPSPTHPPATHPPPTHPAQTQPPPTHPPQTPPPTHAPQTYPPATHPPQTPPPSHAPQTYPPPTHPPQTYPPPTHPPQTYPPPTHPPQTQAPTHPPPTHPPQTYAPPTQPPQTLPPGTHPPQTQPPLTHTPAPTHPPTTYPPPGHIISTTEAPFTSEPQAPGEIHRTDAPGPQPGADDQAAAHTTESNEVKADNEPSGSDEDEDLKHPPHIHDISVECAKDMMTINIEFNRRFDGVIYSKGFYANPECRYVSENSGDAKYSFTVSLNSCGTEFINAFDTQGQSYLENVLVLQNEAGIQEVWDTIRAVRCLWEGNLNKALSVALSVGMLTQEVVTFSGDTAMAKLDIQLGRGPFAPPANGLVKIGDTMTLVVSVTGDPGFDIQVKDCRAKDSAGEHAVALTDESGCVVKPKLFGAFQKTRNTGGTGASIIAYAFFNAFKFPDVMDLMIECNVELCKTDCEMCPDPDQRLEPGRRRRRRRRDAANDTAPALGEPVRMGKALRVIVPEDLSDGEEIVNLGQRQQVCLSTQSFVASSAVLISLLTCATLFSAYQWHRNQRLLHKY